MSSKGLGKRPPVPLDQYFTPDWLIDQMLELVLPEIRFSPPKRILEPSAGNGSFVRALRRRFPNADITAVEIDESLPDIEEADRTIYCSLETYAAAIEPGWHDLVVGNPPFSLAMEHVELGRRCGSHVVFLLRQGFMASQTRSEWLRLNTPSHTFDIPVRPRFGVPEAYLEEYPEDEYGKWGSDSADYAWVGWSPLERFFAKRYWLPVVSKEIRNGKAA